MTKLTVDREFSAIKLIKRSRLAWDSRRWKRVSGVLNSRLFLFTSRLGYRLVMMGPKLSQFCLEDRIIGHIHSISQRQSNKSVQSYKSSAWANWPRRCRDLEGRTANIDTWQALDYGIAVSP